MTAPRIVTFLAALLAVGNYTPAAASDLPVDLELILAIDVSASITEDEQELQREGYASALRSPRVLNAIRSGAYGRIALAYVEWADPKQQEIVVPWMIIEDPATAESVATRLATTPVKRFFGTSISQALLFSAGLFDDNGFAGERRAIDISGNGPNNLGLPVEAARDLLVTQGITINGLPIMIRTRWSAGLYSIAGLDWYFDDCVVGGPGAFTVAVKNEGEFAAAIERKLVLEISARSSLVVLIADERRPHRMDCMAGEKNSGRLLPLH